MKMQPQWTSQQRHFRPALPLRAATPASLTPSPPHSSWALHFSFCTLLGLLSASNIFTLLQILPFLSWPPHVNALSIFNSDGSTGYIRNPVFTKYSADLFPCYLDEPSVLQFSLCHNVLT